MKSRIYITISRFISHLPSNFMIIFPKSSYSTPAPHTSHHRKHPNGTRATKQPQGKQPRQTRTAVTFRAAAATCPARSASRDASWQCITAPAASCHASPAAPHTLCSPSPTSPPFTPAGTCTRRSCAAPAPLPRRRVAPLPRSRRAAPEPPPYHSRAASFRAACSQTREPWACMAVCGCQSCQRDEAKAEAEADTHRETPAGRRARVHATRLASGPARMC